MYSVVEFGAMIADQGRMAPYAAALERAVRPGSVVVDIGTGTGIFAMIACRLGARRVFAIDPNDAIHVARAIAADNGLAGRIDFIQELSTRVTLPERADVIVSDMRGVLPLYDEHIAAIADARARMLAPGGVLIPRRDTLWAAVVDAPELHREYAGPWDQRPHGFAMEPAARVATNSWGKARAAPEQLLVEPLQIATLDYAVVDSPHASATLEWRAPRAGTAHGLLVWFDAELDDAGARFSNRPGAPELVYGEAFFPWPVAVPIDPGDTVSVSFQARSLRGEYVYVWDSRVSSAGASKLDARQSSFFGAPLPPMEKLRRRSATHAPTLGEDGKIDAFVLERMARGELLGEIARALAAAFPARFSTWQDALGRAGDLAEKYAS